MPRPIINEDDCSACGICVDACPNGVLEIVGDAAEPVNDENCDGLRDLHGGVPDGRDHGDRRGLARLDTTRLEGAARAPFELAPAARVCRAP